MVGINLSGTWMPIVTLLICIKIAKCQGPVADIFAVVHGKAILPCDITPPVTSDATILVLWYKDAGDMPIYSFDARSQPGSHTKNEVLLAKRAFFRTVTDPADLSIDSVSESDAGLYRCRVDFLKSPTRNYKVNLTVIVPPQKPTIFDGSGKNIESMVGPYTEGSTMTLTCVASGGRPMPQVTWWRAGALLDDTYTVTKFDGTVQNKIEITGLSRLDLHAVFTCQAANTNMSDPVFTSVQLEMYFWPLQTTILGSNQPLSALRELEIVCQSVGSRPPANITWFKDGQYMEASRHEESATGNISISVLKFYPRAHDHGKRLTCRAQNPMLDASAEEDSWNLDVFFLPILSLALGSSIDAKNIREDFDAYFECKIQANPWIYKVVWLHNGIAVQHNTSAGIIMTNQSLVLQKLKRSSAGTYICKASNIEGEGISNAVELNIMYKPVCRREQKRIYGAAKGEQIEIQCQVDAAPAADSFKWSFNGTTDNIDATQEIHSSNSHKLSSRILRYITYTEQDYGTIFCYASNEVGEQSEPCVFHVIAAGKPDSPRNCTSQNVTTVSLRVECSEGFDGGLPQTFHAEVFDAGSLYLLLNLTAPNATFVITGLRQGQMLSVSIYASNRKGVSDKIVYHEQTIQEAEKRIAESYPAFELTPIFGVCTGVVCCVLLLLIGILLVLKFTKRARTASQKFTVPTKYNTQISEEFNDPDIIPCMKDSEYVYEEKIFNGPHLSLDAFQKPPNGSNYHGMTEETVPEELCHDAAINSFSRHRNRLNEEILVQQSPKLNLHQSEIVSVRMPLLMSSEQESCV